MKKMLSICLSVSLLILACKVADGQQKTSLEISQIQSYTGTPANGPVLTPQTMTFFKDAGNSDFLAYTTPSITVTTSFENQQYTNLATGAMTTGLAFGVIGNGGFNSGPGVTQQPTPAPVFNSLGYTNPGAFSPPNIDFLSYAGVPAADAPSIDVNFDGFGPDVNGGLQIFSNVEALKGLDKAGRYYYGDLRIVFSSAVVNPVIQITSMGGACYVGASPATASYFSTELELSTPGYTSTLLSGSTYLNLSGNNILNNAARPNGASNEAAGNDINGNSFNGAASGSVQINGTVTTLLYKIYVRGSALSDFAFTFDAQPGFTNPFNGDSWMLSYSIGIPLSTTPITYSSFTGAVNNCNANLQWSTAMELNSKNYEVLQSTDGKNWKVAATTAAAGNSSITQNYHASIPLIGTTPNFFKINENDIDGKSHLTNTIRLSCNSLGIDKIQIFPNPATTALKISGLTTGSTFKITANNGQEIIQKRVTSNIEVINVLNWAAGTYVISVIKNGVVDYTAQFVKK